MIPVIIPSTLHTFKDFERGFLSILGIYSRRCLNHFFFWCFCPHWVVYFQHDSKVEVVEMAALIFIMETEETEIDNSLQSVVSHWVHWVHWMENSYLKWVQLSIEVTLFSFSCFAIPSRDITNFNWNFYPLFPIKKDTCSLLSIVMSIVCCQAQNFHCFRLLLQAPSHTPTHQN